MLSLCNQCVACAINEDHDMAGRLVANISTRKPGFNPKLFHVGFVVVEDRIFPEYFCFPLAGSFYELLHTHSFIYHQRILAYS